MRKIKNLLLLFLSTSLISCQNDEVNSSSQESTLSESEVISEESILDIESDDSSNEQSSGYIEEEIQGEVVELNVMNDEAFRLTSINDITNQDGTNAYKMIAPYDDNYAFKCAKASKIEVFNYQRILLKEGKTSLKVELHKGQTVYVRITYEANETFDLNMIPLINMVELPYEINSSIDIDSLDVIGDNSVNPLKPYDISYTKRDDGKGLYINCNNPEALSTQELNTSLIKQDVTDKEVFFTFEHNNIPNTLYYYGYRVTNTDDHDIYVTVKNVGYQVSGAGSWLGEKEWIDFYNTQFYSDTTNFSDSQMANYNVYVGFCNEYEPALNSPTTYRIPKGKYIYVIGGTTKDAYNNINVFDTADIKVNGGCGNGAVIFSVSNGKAQGSFLVYDDSDAKTVNESDYVKGDNVYGYRANRDGVNVGSQYSGYDNCHGVVDSDLMWTFNDLTPSGKLKVNFENKHFVSSHLRENKTIYSAISEFMNRSNKNTDYWLTHINPNNTSNAVGTDMTQYINVDYDSKKPIELNYLHYDGRGSIMNIGNWMVDYIDTITLVNQGDKEREFTYSLKHSGVILAFVRDEQGFTSEYYIPSYNTMINSSKYGAAISDPFTYTIKIAPHSVSRFSVNYNLLANSNGAIGHTATLK